MRRGVLNLALAGVVLFFSSCNRDVASEAETTGNSAIGDEPVNETGYTDMNGTKYSQGIDFWGVGNEPSWAIDIDFDSEFTLKRLGQADVAIPTQKAEILENGVEYSGSSMSFDMVILITDGPCSDNMSGMEYQKNVEVKIRDRGAAEFTSYIGCGNYVIDPKLHDVWVLTEINGKEIKAQFYPKGAPTLELNTTKLMAMGHDGCNNYSGSFLVIEDKITFGPMMSTLMACQGAEEYGYISSILSDSTFTFKYKDNQLQLMKDLELVAKFKHVD